MSQDIELPFICKTCKKNIAICSLRWFRSCPIKACLCRISYAKKCEANFGIRCIYTNYRDKVIVGEDNFENCFNFNGQIEEDEAKLKAFAKELEDFHKVNVYCNRGKNIYYVDHKTDAKQELRLIINEVEKIVKNVCISGAKLFGGFVRDYYIYVIKNKQKINQECKPIKDELNNYLLDPLSSIIIEYTNDNTYIPHPEQDFRDIDVWVTDPKQLEVIEENLLIDGFVLIESDHSKEKSSNPTFNLKKLKLSKNSLTFYLDVVCYPTLPVNDFSCNLLTVGFKESLNPRNSREEVYKVENVGVESLHPNHGFRFDFTVEQILYQIKSKTIYLLPDYYGMDRNFKSDGEYNMKLHRRISDFAQDKKFKILNHTHKPTSEKDKKFIN